MLFCLVRPYLFLLFRKRVISKHTQQLSSEYLLKFSFHSSSNWQLNFLFFYSPLNETILSIEIKFISLVFSCARLFFSKESFQSDKTQLKTNCWVPKIRLNAWIASLDNFQYYKHWSVFPNQWWLSLSKNQNILPPILSIVKELNSSWTFYTVDSYIFDKIFRFEENILCELYESMLKITSQTYFNFDKFGNLKFDLCLLRPYKLTFY